MTSGTFSRGSKPGGDPGGKSATPISVDTGDEPDSVETGKS
jgi:hypothetical protein